MEKIIEFLINPNSTQNIYNLMAIIGFFLSAMLSLRLFIQSRKNVHIEIIDCQRINGYLQLFVYIQNKSSMPLYVSSIQVIATPNNKPCHLMPKPLENATNKNLITTAFPINFTASEGRNLVLEFPDCSDIELGLDTLVDFQVCSNRGALIVSSIPLRMDRYLRTKL